MVFWPILLLAGLGQAGTAAAGTATGLADQCQQMVPWLQRQLGARGYALVRAPLVVAGDLPVAELERWHRETLAPAARAMAAMYFVRQPDRPVVVLLFSGEDAYRRAARRMFGDLEVSSYGYYKPHLHTLLVNTARGTSGALHELTHALAAFDFPAAPVWLAEGLASLNEDCRIVHAPPRLEGRVNWRLARLQEALAAGRLPTLAELLARRDFDGADQALCYAQSRYFCLFLERRGVLAEVYRRARSEHQRDPKGAISLAGLLPGREPAQVEADFRRFAVGLVR
jgi:hypothetical protein